MEDIIRDSIVDETGTIVLAPSAESDPDFKARPISRVKTIHILNQDNTFTCEDFDSPADVCAYLICWRWHQLLKHVRDYRSLGYVLENKAHRMDFLKSSRHDIDNPKRSSYLLSKWRVGPAERQVQWGFGPIAIHPLVDSVAVGDIGHFTPNPEGEVRFQVLFNVAQELGGAKIYNVSKLGGQVMEDDGVRYVRYFPLDQHGEARNIRYSHTASLVDSNLAWSYLARHAFSISARFGLQCEDLVLVTTTFLQLNVTNRPHPNRTYTSFEKLRQAKRMPTFDCVIGPQGQLRGCHWSFEDDPRVEPNKQSKDEIKALDIPETVISSRLGAFVQLESGDAYEDRPACKL
ncbi:hypothetical protein FRC02_007934 [Tulasnella sp. 418]|nr:hypothetical protein FRC02_007934 [Tulasnella sp. 418]